MLRRNMGSLQRLGFMEGKTQTCSQFAEVVKQIPVVVFTKQNQPCSDSHYSKSH